MRLPLAFHRAARVEFDQAADWYDEQRTGLGAAFTAAVQNLLDQIRERPLLYPVALDDIREAHIAGFPYCVYYNVNLDRVLVLAVFHTSRDPSIWQSRF